jgi:hypothetical protein
MRRIQFAEIIRRALCELVLVQARQVVLRGELLKNLFQRALKKCGSPEQTPAFGNVQGAELACPLEDVVEEEAVDRFKLRSVEPAGRCSSRLLIGLQEGSENPGAR